jgi:hypothetical protein
MTRRQILAQLSKIANDLDDLGLHDEADTTTKVMEKIDRSNPAYDTSNPYTYDISDIYKETYSSVARLFKILLNTTQRHRKEILSLHSSLLDRYDIIDTFIDYILESLETIDLTGEYYSPDVQEPKKPGFFDKFTQKINDFLPKSKPSAESTISTPLYDEVDRAINEINKVCGEAVAKFQGTRDSLPFDLVNKLEKVKSDYTSMIAQNKRRSM